LKLDPEYMQAYYFRAFAHEKKGKYDLAIADYSSAIVHVDSKSDLAKIYHHRALAYRKDGNNELALADYGEALKINPEYTDAYFSRALLFQKDKQYEAAIADYSRAIELQPEHAEAFYNRGLLYRKAGTDHLAMVTCPSYSIPAGLVPNTNPF
jgi:tetratricopeptide (TPR) repeat protein